MNVLSLFAGIGGLDLGLERAGMTVVGQVEIDPFCQRVLGKHWPEVPRHDDVRTAVAWWLDRARPAVDVVAGGFPCQPVSLAGQRRAQEDERWLWPAAWAVIRDLRPRYAILENVPGLLTRGMGDVLGDLAAIGYDAEWDCIPAAAVGAPHRRDRVFIVAYPDGSGWNAQQRVPTSTGRHDGPDPARSGPDVADAARPRLERPRLSGRPPQHRRWAPEPDVGRVASRIPLGLDGGLNAHSECITQGSTAGVPSTGRLRALQEHIAAAQTPSGSERCTLCGHPLSALPCRGACSPWYVGGRIEGAEGLRCVREGVLGLLAHEGQDLLAGVPQGSGATQRTQTMGSRVDRLRSLGNAVVPQVAEHIGRLVMEVAA